MNTVTVQDTETDIPSLLADIEAGNEVVISRGKQPIAKVTPIQPKPKIKRMPGRYKGLIEVPDSFFDPMTEEELALWESGKI